MAVSPAASGSQTATLNTDHTLVTQAAPATGAIYQLRVDTANLANGERLILRLQTKVRSSDTTRNLYTTVFEHSQGDPIKDSPAVPVITGCEVVAVLRQEGGTGRAYPWALYRLDG